MKWTEAKLTAGLRKCLEVRLPGSVVLKHTELLRGGVPDLSVTWNGRTTWLEVKFANPRFVSRGIQRLLIEQLHEVGSAYYIIYDSRAIRTIITDPRHLTDDGCYYTISDRNYSNRFADHDHVAHFLWNLHS